MKSLGAKLHGIFNTTMVNYYNSTILHYYNTTYAKKKRTSKIQENWSGDAMISHICANSTFSSMSQSKTCMKKALCYLQNTSYLHIAITLKRIKLQSRGCSQIIENSVSESCVVCSIFKS